ncbi:hypothetical protein LSO12E_30070 [Candidatus Liberibacter solanacearum]
MMIVRNLSTSDDLIIMGVNEMSSLCFSKST